MRNNDLRSWGTSILPWSGYTDDLVLFLQSQAALQKATELLDDVFASFDLSINKSKTDTMVLNSNEMPDTVVSLGNICLKNVNTFKYLGANIDAMQPSTSDSEINHRIQLACIKFAEMSNLLQNFHINLSTRTTFLNCFIRSRLTYSCQNWSLTASQFERLDTTYRTFLRRMVRNGFKQVDRDTNDFRLVISKDALHTTRGTRDVSNIKTQQSNYASHITRTSYERSLKQLMFNDDVYTKRGRSTSITDRTSIEQVIHHRNISIEKFCALSINRRVGWKSYGNPIRLPTNKRILSIYSWKFYCQSILSLGNCRIYYYY